MYAVLSSGGKQYRVEAGSTLTLERLEGEPGTAITFDRILLIGDGEEVLVGTPVVPGASVTGVVLGESRGPKLVIFKFKQKVKYRRRTGHRQHLTTVRIEAINPSEATAARRAAEAAKASSETAAASGPRRSRAAATSRATATKPAREPAAAEGKPAASRPRARRAAKPKAEE